MDHGAEINRFAIFLFCLLVPLGSSAPAEQMQKPFTTNPENLASLIEWQATNLFEHYKSCLSSTLQDDTWLLPSSREREMVERISNCSAFQADCCALHQIHQALQTLGGTMESLCPSDPQQVLRTNLNQLSSTLSEGTTFYTCRMEELPQVLPSHVQSLGWAEKKIYLWWLLEKYIRVMGETRKHL